MSLEFPFSGREREFGMLENFIEKAEGGQGSLVFITGEPGVGKTTLAVEVGKLAKKKGMVSLSGKCPKGGSLLPYQVWVECLRQFTTEASVRIFFDVCGSLSGQILKLLPELGSPERPLESLGRAAEPQQSIYELARHSPIQIFDALTQFFFRLSNRSPVLLILDDFQWCDQSSLELLRHFAASGFGSQRLLVLCLARDTSLESENPRLTRFVSEDSMGEGPKALIRLERLDKESATSLVQSISRGAKIRELNDLLYRKTSGNPLFMRETLALMAERGEFIKDSEGKWYVSGPLVIEVPATVKDVVKQRLGPLDGEVVEVLRIAGLVGEEFSLGILQKAAGLNDEDQLIRRLEKAMAVGLIRERALSEGRSVFYFADETLIDVLVEGISLERLRRHHLAIARAMEEVYGERRDERAAELAFHYRRGNSLEKCIEYARKAGDSAAAVYAHEEASRHYAMAIAAFKEIGGNEQDLQFGVLLEHLGDQLWMFGDAVEPFKNWEEAAMLYGKLEDSERAGGLHSKMGWLYVSQAQREKSIEQFNVALKFLLNARKGPGLAYLYHHLGSWYFRDEQFDESRKWYRKAIELAKELRMLDVEMVSSAVLACALPMSEMETALELLRKAEQTAIDVKSSTADLSLSIAYGWVGAGHILLRGDFHAGLKWYLESVRVAKLLGERQYVAWAQAVLATNVYIPLGEWSKAREGVTESSPSSLVQSYPLVKARALLALGTLALYEGELGKAEKYFSEIRSETSRFGSWPERDYACGFLGLLYITKEDYARAERYLKEGYDYSKRNGLTAFNGLIFGRTVYFLVQLCLRQGKEEEAATFLAELRDLAKISVADWAHAYQFEAAGDFASYKEEWDQAQEHYEESAKYWERMGWPYHLAQTRQALSTVHRAKGEIEIANQILDVALAEFTRLGATLDARKAESSRKANIEEEALPITRVVRDGSERTKVIFDYLVNAFTGDYFVKRLSHEAAGWRSFVEIANGTKVPISAFYGTRHSDMGGLGELERMGLAEARVFRGQRGRGGKITRARIAFDKDEVKQYITKKRKKRGEMATAMWK